MTRLLTAIIIVTTAAVGLVPLVAMAIGQKAGPCTVSVSCIGGSTVSCSGATQCIWKYDSLSSRGFVQCDSDPANSCSFSME